MPSMEHSLKVRHYLKDLLVSVLGKDRLEEWFVEFLPGDNLMEDMKPEQRMRRHMFFATTYFLMAVCFAMSLEVLRHFMNWYRRYRRGKAASRQDPQSSESSRPRSETQEPLLDRESSSHAAVPEEMEGGEDAMLEEMRESVKSYTRQDLFFIAYQHIYIFLCLALTTYGFLNDYLSRTTGLDYELYFPWFVFTMFMHFFTLVAAFMKQTTARELPTVLLAVFKTLNPSDGHLGTLRDAVAGGIYAQYSFAQKETFLVGPLVLSFICIVCIFLPNVGIVANIHPFRDFQELYWPILIESDRVHLTPPPKKDDRKCLARLKDGFYKAKTSLKQACSWGRAGGGDDASPSETSSWVWKTLDQQTREHKQWLALLGDLPQALVGCIFTLFYVKGTFIVLVTGLAAVKTFFIIFVRPNILCCMASSGIPWQHLTGLDVWRAVSRRRGCTDMHLSNACRGLLKNAESPKPVRLEALSALGKIHKMGEQDRTGEIEDENFEQERQNVLETVLWEFATNEDSRIKARAETVLNSISKLEDKKSRDAAARLMKKMRSKDLKECAEALVKLARDHSLYANAYKKDFVKCLTMALPPFPRKGSSSGDNRSVSGDMQHSGCVCLNCSLPRWGTDEDDVLDEDYSYVKQDAEEKHALVLQVRYCAARGLALLGDQSKKAGEPMPQIQTQEKREAQQKAQAAARAVDRVAPSVIELLDRADKDEDLRMAALTAVVHFHGEAAVKALEKAMEMLRKGENLLIAEILLVQLLRHVAVSEEVQAKRLVEEVANKLGNPDDNMWKLAQRVLLRTGGRAAKVIYDVLEAKGCLKDRDLELVLSKQKEAALVLEKLVEKVPDAEGMNLKLDPEPDAIKTVEKFCASVRKEVLENKKDLFSLLYDLDAAPAKMSGVANDTNKDQSTLVIFLTDLEPDDDMCIMQVCNFLRKKKTPFTPMIVFCADFNKKDKDDIFPLKLMLAALVVGEADYQVLVPASAAPRRCGSERPSENKPEEQPLVQNNPTEQDDAQPGCGWLSSGAQSKTSGGRPSSSSSVAPVESPRDTKTKDGPPGRHTEDGFAERATEMYWDSIDHIVKTIGEFEGKEIRFYVCAPGRGNLSAIVKGLADKGYKQTVHVNGEPVPVLKTKLRRVSLYSGQFNVRGMDKADLDALKRLVDNYDEVGTKIEGAITDVSKYPFFGGDDTPQVSQSFNTFALPSFAPWLSIKKPIVCAAWWKLNGCFNSTLISPAEVFQVESLDHDATLKADLDRLYYEEKNFKEYAFKLCQIDDFAKKVKKKKQTTVKAFACDACDAPLCDQLLFLEHWAADHAEQQKQQHEKLYGTDTKWQPSPVVSCTKGTWVYDTMNTITSVVPNAKGLEARRPELREAFNVGALYQLQQALQDNCFEHLDSQTPMTKEEVQKCRVFQKA